MYCLVRGHYQALAKQQSIRRGGFAPALTGEEVITIEICGEYLKGGTDKDIVAYFRAHYRAFFPRLRKGVETVGSHLTERFAVVRIRVHDLWHVQHRLIRKVLAHTVGVFLNRQLGRDPLDLDGLLAALALKELQIRLRTFHQAR